MPRPPAPHRGPMPTVRADTSGSSQHHLLHGAQFDLRRTRRGTLCWIATRITASNFRVIDAMGDSRRAATRWDVQRATSWSSGSRRRSSFKAILHAVAFSFSLLDGYDRYGRVHVRTTSRTIRARAALRPSIHTAPPACDTSADRHDSAILRSTRSAN